jgi:hypothetical protein
MHSFELREVEEGFALKGGQLEKPLFYQEKDADPAIRLVGFLSQQQGSTLKIYDRDGTLRSTQHREPAMPLNEDSLGASLRCGLPH